MQNRKLALAISLVLSTSVTAQQDEWLADPNYDPVYGELAAPRTHPHPIDQMIRLAEFGIESAQETLDEWEADPAWHDRLHQREAYREYARARAAKNLERRLAKAEELEEANKRNIRRASAKKAEGSSSPKTAADTGSAKADTETQAEEVDLQAELASLRSTVQSLTADRNELASKLAALEEKHAKLQVAHKALQSEHESLQVAHEALQSEHKRVVAENEALSQRYADLQDRFDTLNAKHEALMAQVSAPKPGARSLSALMSASKDKADRPSAPELPKGDEKSEAALAREEIEAEASLEEIQRQVVESEEAINLNERGLEALDDNRPAAALGWFLRAARSGSTNAMNNLGYLYEKGWGALPSAQEAIRWYERAAEAGHVHAMRNVARFYEHGIGVLENSERAAYWRERAEQTEHSEQKIAQAEETTENRG